MATSFYGIFLAVLASALWGLIYIVLEKLLKTFSPVQALFGWCLFNFVILAGFFLVKGDLGQVKAIFHSKHLVFFLLSGAIALSANLCILKSIQLLGAPTASVLEIAYPFFTVLFLWMLYSERPTLGFAIGAFLMFAGASTIILTRPT